MLAASQGEARDYDGPIDRPVLVPIYERKTPSERVSDVKLGTHTSPAVRKHKSQGWRRGKGTHAQSPRDRPKTRADANTKVKVERCGAWAPRVVALDRAGRALWRVGPTSRSARPGGSSAVARVAHEPTRSGRQV